MPIAPCRNPPLQRSTAYLSRRDDRNRAGKLRSSPAIEIKPLDEYSSSDASPLRPDVVAAVKAAVAAIHPGVPVTPGMAGRHGWRLHRAAGIPTYGVGESS
jgi:hypothetical protein